MTAQAATLSRIGRLCTGCGACSAVTPAGTVEMRLSHLGYLRPFATRALSREEDRRIAALCPGVNVARTGLNGTDHPIWGPIVRVRTGHASDPNLRHRASSGGVLSAVLAYLLENGLVDRVVQTAASDRAPVENATVESTSFAQVLDAAGSRYAPSAPLADIRSQLDRPGRFALVGKPCDIAAVRAMAKTDPAIAETVPYLISFFCAGIPSVRGARAILARLGLEEDTVAAFRYRGEGWPGFATARTKDGEERRMSYAESWGDILSKHVQFRCKICPDGSGGFADLVCADAWYGDEDGYPTFDEAEGRSLVITRTEKGENVVQRAERAGYLSLTDIAVGEVEKMQPHQARRKQLVLSRLAALKLMRQPAPHYRGLALWRSAAMAGLWPNLRSFLGMLRRAATGRLDA